MINGHLGGLSVRTLARGSQRNIFLKLLSILLSFQFAFPSWAAEGDNAQALEAPRTPAEAQAEASLSQLQQMILKSGDASSRLAFTAVQRNIGFLLHQDLIDSQTGRVWDLTDVNLSRPKVTVGAGLVARGLKVDKTPNGIVLSIEGSRYQHRIRFNPGVELLDFDWDAELVELLLTDGTRHAIEVSSLGPTAENMAQGLLFSAPVPIFYLGRPVSENGKPITGIRILQRRVDPVDRSRAAQEARLDRNPKTREKGLIASNSGLVKRVEENLDLVRPIPLALELEARLKSASPDGVARLNAGDTALTHFDGQSETIVAIDDRTAEIGMIGLQMGSLSGLWYVASPESAQATKEIFDLRASAKTAVSEIVSSELGIKEFFDTGLQGALAQIPASSLNATHAYAQKTAVRIAELKKLGTPNALRDSFTLGEQLEDYRYYQEYLAELRAKAAIHEARSRFNPTRYADGRRWAQWANAIGSGIANFDLPARMRQAVHVLKKPLLIGAAAVALTAGAAGIDQTVTHGENVALAVDTMAATWNHTIDYTVPVFRNFNYVKDMTLHTLTSRTGLLLSIFLIAALARPFTQHSMNKLIAATGIKYFFSYSIMPPQRLLATLTLRPELIDAMKRGHLPLELLHPLGNLSSGWSTRLESASRHISEQNRIRTLATIVSLQSLAHKRGVGIHQLLSSPDSEASHASNLCLALVDVLANSSQGALFRELHSDPEDFFKALGQARLHASSRRMLSDNPRTVQAIVRSSITRQFLSSIGNFQEARYLALRNPQPPQDFADYITRSYLVDGVFTLMVSSLSGSYADLAHSENLAYQPDSPFLWTHKFVWINDFEQIFLHLGASAAVDFLSAGLESREAFSNLKPAALYDSDREVGSRSFGTDSLSTLGLLFNLRKNNYLVGFGERSWNQCVRLLQGFLIIGMGLRLFEGVLDGQPLASIFTAHAFEHALVGQLYFVFVAPFVYRWFWAVAITTTRTLQKEVMALGQGFSEHFTELTVALQRGDSQSAQREARYLVELYSRNVRGVPQSVLDSLTPRENENVAEWVNRVLEACRNSPPVPETTNERANKSIIFVGSVITTILAGYLMVDSFQNRPFRGFDVPEGSMGFDLTDWWAWDGMSRTDSMPTLMFKSLLNIWAVWGAGHLLNMGFDVFRMARAKTPEEATERWQEYIKTELAAGSLPILNLAQPREKLLKPGADGTCASLLEG